MYDTLYYTRQDFREMCFRAVDIQSDLTFLKIFSYFSYFGWNLSKVTRRRCAKNMELHGFRTDICGSNMWKRGWRTKFPIALLLTFVRKLGIIRFVVVFSTNWHVTTLIILLFCCSILMWCEQEVDGNRGKHRRVYRQQSMTYWQHKKPCAAGDAQQPTQ